MDNYLTSKQACEYYEITRQTLWRWAAKGVVKQYQDPNSNRKYYSIEAIEPLYNIKETCYMLGMSRSTLERRIANGEIKPFSENSSNLFTKKEIERYRERTFLQMDSIMDKVEKLK